MTFGENLRKTHLFRAHKNLQSLRINQQKCLVCRIYVAPYLKKGNFN